MTLALLASVCWYAVTPPTGEYAERRLVDTASGREREVVVFDQDAARRIVERFERDRAEGARVIVDIDHESARHGFDRSRTAGEIVALKADVDGAVLAHIRFTAFGRLALTSGAYSHFSPHFEVTRGVGSSITRPCRLCSVALTSRPFAGELVIQPRRVEMAESKSEEGKKAEKRAKWKAYYEAHKEARRASARASYEAHKAERLATVRKYAAAHKTEKAAYNKEYREANKEKIHEKNRVWREAHREELREYAAEYYQANREKCAAWRKAHYAKPEVAEKCRAARRERYAALDEQGRREVRAMGQFAEMRRQERLSADADFYADFRAKRRIRGALQRMKANPGKKPYRPNLNMRIPDCYVKGEYVRETALAESPFVWENMDDDRQRSARAFDMALALRRRDGDDFKEEKFV